MKEGLSARLRLAVDYLISHGWAKNCAEVAHRIGVTNSTLSMAMNGQRTPTWDLLLTFSDLYPISFDWLRNGGKYIIKGERETELLRRIEELEHQILTK